MNVAIVYVQELAPTSYRGEFGVGIGPCKFHSATSTLAHSPHSPQRGIPAGWLDASRLQLLHRRAGAVSPALASTADARQNWRIPLILGNVWALLLIAAVFFVPESCVSMTADSHLTNG
jgi:hypothetical protein